MAIDTLKITLTTTWQDVSTGNTTVDVPFTFGISNNANAYVLIRPIAPTTGERGMVVNPGLVYGATVSLTSQLYARADVSEVEFFIGDE